MKCNELSDDVILNLKDNENVKYYEIFSNIKKALIIRKFDLTTL